MTAIRPSGVAEPVRAHAAVPAPIQEAAPQVPFGARANANARRKFAPRYLLNTLRNIPVIAASADVTALFDAFPGVPAVVVAAGPSLDRNLEALRDLAPHVLMIAVDTALRPLLEAGIEPQLVVAVDPSDLNARHLRHLPDTARTWLVAEGSLDPAAFEWFAGRAFTFAVSDHEPWAWLRAAGLGRGRLRAWGSVVTSGCDLALRLGCNPIVFAGADLAYTGGQPYCRGTVYEHDWARRAALGESLTDVWAQMTEAKARLRADDIDGRPVPTSPALLAFRDWLVKESAAQTGRRFINGTGGGVLAGGRLEQRSLTQVLAEIGGLPRVGDEAVAAAWRGWRAAHGSGVSGAQVAPGLRGGAAGLRDQVLAWQRWAGPDLSVTAVEQALEDARGGLPAQWSQPALAGRSSHAGGAPERVMAIRAAIAGDSTVRSPGSVTPSAGQSTGASGALEEAGRLLATLLQMPAALLSPGTSAPRLPSALAPASRAFPWREGVEPLVRAFEAALAEVVGGGRALSRMPRALDVPMPDEQGPQPTGLAWAPVEASARIRLVADWLSVSAVAAAEPCSSIPAGRAEPPRRLKSSLLRAFADALFSPTDGAVPDAISTGPSAAILLGGDVHRLPCSPGAARLADALAGSLLDVPADSAMPAHERLALSAVSVTVPDGVTEAGLRVTVALGVSAGPPSVDNRPEPAWPPVVSSAPAAGWILPVRLSTPLPGCMVGSAVDDGHARFTVVNGAHSIRVDSTGSWTADRAWPGPAVGEVCWGATGAVAWHNGVTSRVLWRERPDGPVETGMIPFTACQAFPQADGSIWWTSFDGGLWSWAPGRPWERMVATPPVMGLLITPEGVCLQPSGDDPTFATPPALTDAFLWRFGASTAERVPLGPDGPCWSAASQRGWTALAYPHGHCIHLRHADGGHYALVCSQPFNVAWAGASLVASTRRGELLLFRDLLTHLECARADCGHPRLD